MALTQATPMAALPSLALLRRFAAPIPTLHTASPSATSFLPLKSQCARSSGISTAACCSSNSSTSSSGNNNSSSSSRSSGSGSGNNSMRGSSPPRSRGYGSLPSDIDSAAPAAAAPAALTAAAAAAAAGHGRHAGEGSTAERSRRKKERAQGKTGAASHAGHGARSGSKSARGSSKGGGDGGGGSSGVGRVGGGAASSSKSGRGKRSKGKGKEGGTILSQSPSALSCPLLLSPFLFPSPSPRPPFSLLFPSSPLPFLLSPFSPPVLSRLPLTTSTPLLVTRSRSFSYYAVLGLVAGGGSPLPRGLRCAVLRVLLDARLFPACFPARSSEWRPLVQPVAPGRLESSARPGPVARLERRPMDFLGALGCDRAVEVDLAPRPLPPARPAASVLVAPPAAADEIRRRFEDQRRDLGLVGGGSLPLGEAARVGSVARSGAEAVAHRGHSPRHRSPVAHDGRRESRHDDRRAGSRPPRSPRSLRSPRSPRRKVSRSRSRDHRSYRHRSPAPRSSRPRSPARHASGYRSLAPRSPPLAKRPRLYSPRHTERSPDRQRQRGLSRPQSPMHSSASGRAHRGRWGGYGRGGAALPAPSAMEQVLKKALHRSHAGSSSQSAPPAAPVAPLAALLPHNPVGSPARSVRPLPAGTGFVGAGGGDPWAQFAPPRPLPAPRDLAVSARRSRASAFPPQMKPVPTATLAHLWSLAECLQSLELILQESHGSMLETPPSTFSQMPRVTCHAAASALFSFVSPLQVAPSPGVVTATLLAETALGLRTLVATRGTPVDVVGATASVVRQMWLTTREMLGELEADRIFKTKEQLPQRRKRAARTELRMPATKLAWLDDDAEGEEGEDGEEEEEDGEEGEDGEDVGTEGREEEGEEGAEAGLLVPVRPPREMVERKEWTGKDSERWLNAARRDFTVNGLMLDPFSGTLYDYVGALHDIKTRVLRTIQPALPSFLDDPVRVLRAMRMAAKARLSLHEDIVSALESPRLLSSLAHVNKERVQQEVTLLLSYGSSETAVRLLWSHRLMPLLLPLHSARLLDRGFPTSPSAAATADDLLFVSTCCAPCHAHTSARAHSHACTPLVQCMHTLVH
ncbi:unnamed protein product [Closterium sp. NIES-53]